MTGHENHDEGIKTMKVLQLLSDWKWTGSSEPVTSLCKALAEEGVDVTLAYRKAPSGRPKGRSVEKEVHERGIKASDALRLNRYFSPADWIYDLRHIRRFVEKEGVDIVHTNLSHDHFLTLLSLRSCRKRPLVVRTDHKWNGIAPTPFMQWAFSNTDSIVAYSRKILEQDMKTFGFSRERTCLIPPALTPAKEELKDLRPELGIGGHERVIGFAGRLKIDRGYDIILKAFRIVKNRSNDVKMLIVGRGGSEDEKLIGDLIRDLGLQKDVIRAGYRTDDYFSVMSAFDIFVIMRAGTDGTARALREAMSLGIPPVVSDRGMLPELVDDGATGFVVKPEAPVLAERLLDLLSNDEQRRSMGAKAREKAHTCWSYKAQAQTLLQFYETLLREGKKRS